MESTLRGLLGALGAVVITVALVETSVGIRRGSQNGSLRELLAGFVGLRGAL
jgi:hypothetical protein